MITQALHQHWHRAVAAGLGLGAGGLMLWVLPDFRLTRQCAGWGGWSELALCTVILGVAAGMMWLARVVGWLSRERLVEAAPFLLASTAALLLVVLLLVPRHLDRRRDALAKATFIEMRQMSNKLWEYYDAHGDTFPEANSVAELVAATGGEISLPLVDAWGTPYQLRTSAQSFDLISCGQCGQPDPPRDPNEWRLQFSDDYRDDLAILNGEWSTWHNLPGQHPEHD